jgi:hypothetical protein
MEAMKRLGDLWCSVMHESPLWPIHGHYQCRTCGREYPVAWQDTNPIAGEPNHRILEFAAASK